MEVRVLRPIKSTIESKISDSSNYVWEEVHVRKNLRTKMYGLYCKQALRKFTFIPYFGAYFPQVPKSYLESIPKDQAKYILSWEETRKCTIVDATPTLHGWNHGSSFDQIGMRGLAIGGKINEPGKDDPFNCMFVGPDNGFTLPFRNMAMILTVQDIAVGTELLLSYGKDYSRTLPHKAAVSPRSPTLRKYDEQMIRQGFSYLAENQVAIQKWLSTKSKSYFEM